jgi:Fic family protein
MKKLNARIVKEFLQHSNWIEREYSELAYKDALSAWKYALTLLDKKVTVKDILKIHYELVKNIEPDIAGKIRNCDVWIGGKKKMFISEALLKEELKGICNMMNRTFKNPLCQEEMVKITHVAFEGVHPFEDGNGRTGRILYNLHRLKFGLPVHVIHADYPELDGEQMEYYSWFKNN